MKRRIRLHILAVLAIVTALGFALKYYSGPGQWWVNNWGPASVAYEIFFMLLAFFVMPKRRAITPIAVCVCLVTCGLEFLQLWKPPWLMTVRATFLGKGLLGDTFSWWDLPAYVIGCVIGWYLLQWLAGAHRADGPDTDAALTGP